MITTEQKREVEKAKAEIRAKKDRIKRLQFMSRGRAGEFWAALKEDLELSIQSLERQRDNALDLRSAEDPGIEYAELRALRRAQLAYKGIIHNVEQAETKIERLNDETREINEFITKIESGKTPSRRNQEVV